MGKGCAMKLKKNIAIQTFYCLKEDQEKCQYCEPENDKCKYSSEITPYKKFMLVCTNRIAHVNRMVLELIEEGIIKNGN